MAVSEWASIISSTNLAVNTVDPWYYDKILDLRSFEGASVMCTAVYTGTPVSTLRVFALNSLGEVKWDGTAGGVQAGETLTLATGPDRITRNDGGSWITDGWLIDHEFLMEGDALAAGNKGWFTVDPDNAPTASVLRVVAAGDGPNIPLVAGGPHADLKLTGGLWSTQALSSRSIDSDPLKGAAPMLLRGHKIWRVAALRDGPTDLINTVMHHRLDGVRL